MALLGVIAVLWWTNEGLRANAVGGGRKLIYSAPFATLLAMVSLNAAGCGGGGSSAAQTAPITQQVGTPQGTSQISVTLIATTSSGKQLPAVPIQLTLTVK